MSERNEAMIEAAQEQLMRRYSQEIAMAHNARGLGHDELMRLRRIEAAAREMFALDKGGFTNVDAFELKYEALRKLMKP